MSTPYYEYEYELESLPELEGIYESEWEGETAGSFEAEQFFQELSQAARRGTPLHSLQRLAMSSARSALSNGGVSADGYDAQSLMGLSEYEGEFESGGAAEGEMEQALHYMQQTPSAAMMEHLGHAAAEAETEGESFAFLAPLIPLAMKALPLAAKGIGMLGKAAAKNILPRIASNITRNAPRMIRSLQGVARTLHSNPRTRPLVRTLPTVARRATADLVRQAARGRPVTPQAAVRAIARQTAQVIGSPQQAVQAWQGSRDMDRKFHTAAGGAMPPLPDVIPPSVMSEPVSNGKKCCCSCGH